MSKESIYTFIEQFLQSVDVAVSELKIEDDPRVTDFSRDNDGHGFPGRRFSFIGTDLISRNIHVYVNPEDKDLKMSVQVNAWLDANNERKYTNVPINSLSIPVLPETVKDTIKDAFDNVIKLNQTDLH